MFRTLQQLFSTTPSAQKLAAMASAKEKVQKLVDDNAVVVFSKSYCPYCSATKKTLGDLNVNFKLIELDEEADGSAMQDALQEITGQRTVPNVFIQQKHVGGNSDVQSLFKSGDLKKKLEAASAIKA